MKLPRINIANLLVAVVLLLVPFYAILTVWTSSLIGHFTLLRLWDDFLLLMLLIIVGAWTIRDRKLRQMLSGSPLFRLIIAYACITIVFGLLALLRHDVTLKAFAYAALVNIRFLLWFIAVWVVATKNSWLKANWPKLIFWPLLLVSLFALLQFFILPHDFLTHFGYGNNTYVPEITINQNTATIRVQSFLRGTNELGAYLVMALGLLTACVIGFWRRTWKWLLGAVAFVALILSFSRSAWIGTFVTIALVVWLSLKKSRTRIAFISGTTAVMILLILSVILLHKNHGVEDAFFHVSSGSTAQVTSNAGHASALRSGLDDLIHQPFGKGPGTAGPASWYNSPHPVRNSENYFLEIGQELGWIGLIFFISINLLLGLEFWRRRDDTLALGLLAALIGLSVVNQFTYAWSDDTLAFIFWGLAGIAMAKPFSADRKEFRLAKKKKA